MPTTGPFVAGLWITFTTGFVVWWPARREHAERNQTRS